MTFAEGLLRARSHIVFILGLLSAVGVISMTDRLATPTRVPTSGVARSEAAAWAWAAASRSTAAADVAKARELARSLGVSPDDAPATNARLSPAAGLATLDALYARTHPAPRQVPAH